MSQSEITAYIAQLTPQEQKVLKIAQEHLETSFNLVKSIGFKEWQAQQAQASQTQAQQTQAQQTQAQQTQAQQTQAQQTQAQQTQGIKKNEISCEAVPLLGKVSMQPLLSKL
jgi:hypothetical protein